MCTRSFNSFYDSFFVCFQMGNMLAELVWYSSIHPVCQPATQHKYIYIFFVFLVSNHFFTFWDVISHVCFVTFPFNHNFLTFLLYFFFLCSKLRFVSLHQFILQNFNTGFFFGLDAYFQRLCDCMPVLLWFQLMEDAFFLLWKI